MSWIKFKWTHNNFLNKVMVAVQSWKGFLINGLNKIRQNVNYLAGTRTLKNLNRNGPASIVRGVCAISATRPTDQLSTQVDFIPFQDLLSYRIMSPNTQQISIHIIGY